MNLRWSLTNRKLSKLRIVSFGLPAFEAADGSKVCPGAGSCAKFCFARNGWYSTPRVAKPREHNLGVIRSDLALFPALVVQDLMRLPHRTVRVHDSGDFFSQEYLDAWFTVARAMSWRSFYAYTKSLHLDLWKSRPRNFTIVQSRGGKFDHLIDLRRPVARVFADLEDLHGADYEHANEDDEPALAGAPRVGLVYHGNRRLQGVLRESIL